MDENIEILLPNGSFSGISVAKSEAHRKGILHATVHVWLYTRTGKVVLQQRSHTKNTFPGLWDVSVAGHIAYKEHLLSAAIRETKEELDLNLDASDLKKVGVFTEKHHHPIPAIIDNEMHHVYCSLLPCELHNLTRQQTEVAAIQLVSLETLENWVQKKEEQLVPHLFPYYRNVISFIRSQVS